MSFWLVIEYTPADLGFSETRFFLRTTFSASRLLIVVGPFFTVSDFPTNRELFFFTLLPFDSESGVFKTLRWVCVGCDALSFGREGVRATISTAKELRKVR